MERVLTKRRMLIVLAVVIFLAAWNRGISLLYVIFSLQLSTLLIAHLFPRFALKGITAVRATSPTAFEDDELEIQTEVINRSGHTRRMVEIFDWIPAAASDQQRPLSFVTKIQGHKQRQFTYNVRCDKRGEYTLGPLCLRSGFPLGLTTQQRMLPETTASLVVYPKVFPISRLPLSSGRNRPRPGVETVSKAGGSEDFFGTREYSRGDSPRYIHWPSTAKHSKLIVKEFEVRASAEVTIFLDLHRRAAAGEGKENSLEYAVKIAASVANYCLDKGYDMQLIAQGAHRHIVPTGRGVHQFARILERLARVDNDGERPYPEVISSLASMMQEGSTAVIIFSDDRNDIVQSLHAMALLQAMHIHTVCVFIDQQSFSEDTPGTSPFENPLVQNVLGFGSPAYFVRKGDNFQEVFAAS